MLFSAVPISKKIAYNNMIYNCVRLIIGDNVLDYFGDVSSPAAYLPEANLSINIVILCLYLGARFMYLDIKDHFLQSILDDPEYLKIHSK